MRTIYAATAVLCAAALVLTFGTGGAAEKGSVRKGPARARSGKRPSGGGTERGRGGAEKKGEGVRSARSPGPERPASPPQEKAPGVAKEATGKDRYPEGKMVKKGEVVARIESLDSQKRLEDRELKLINDKKDYDSVSKNKEIELERLKLMLQEAKDNAAIAEIQKNETLTPTADEQKMARLDLTTAKLSYDTAKERFDVTARLAAKAVVSQTELDDKKLAMQLAEKKYKKAQLDYRELMENPDAPAKRKARVQAELAAIDFRLTELDVKNKKRNIEEDILRKRTKVTSIEAEIKRITALIDKATIRAPEDGLVIHRSHHRRGKFYVGRRTSEGRGIIDICDVSAFKVRTHVNERYINDIGKGTRAHVTIESIKDRNEKGVESPYLFTGHVIWIDKWARDKNANLDDAGKKRAGLSGIKVFDVEVQLDKYDRRLRIGAKAKVAVYVKRFADVVFVDKRAVFWEKGKTYVRVRRGGGEELREVETGSENMRHIIIKKGLAPGEEVLL